MAFKYLILVIVLVNLCNGQYPNIVPGLNGVLDPSFIGYPPQFPGSNSGLDPSLTGYPPHYPGQLPTNSDYDGSDVMSYAANKGAFGNFFNPENCACQDMESARKCCQEAGSPHVVGCQKGKAFCKRRA